jgi:hypothetical protein
VHAREWDRRGPRLVALVRDAWRACSAPERFFLALEERGGAEPLRAAAAASIAVVVGLGALSLAFVRATSSDGLLLVWSLSLALALPAFALVALFGGLVLARTAALDLRAWEVVLWAYAPAGALALSLVPAIFVAPGVSAAAGLLAFPVWHVTIVVAALRALAPRRRVSATLAYLIATFAVPVVLAAIGSATLRASP